MTTDGLAEVKATPKANRRAEYSFVSDLARFRIIKRRLGVWVDGMANEITPLRKKIANLRQRHETHYVRGCVSHA